MYSTSAAMSVPEILAGSVRPDSCRSLVSSRTGSPRSVSPEREEKVFGDEKGRDVRLLLAAAVPQERIAALTGVSVRTIRRIGREPAGPAPPEPGAKPRWAGPERPSVVAAYREAVADMLAAEPRLKSLEVLRRLRERDCTGGKSTAYALAKRLRPQAVRPSCAVCRTSSGAATATALCSWRPLSSKSTTRAPRWPPPTGGGSARPPDGAALRPPGSRCR